MIIGEGEVLSIQEQVIYLWSFKVSAYEVRIIRRGGVSKAISYMVQGCEVSDIADSNPRIERNQ